MKRTTAARRLALEVLEAPQRTEPAIYLKLTLYWGTNASFQS